MNTADYEAIAALTAQLAEARRLVEIEEDRATRYGNMARMALKQTRSMEEIDAMLKELGL